MTIYRMIRTVDVADTQETLNEMVRCLENGDHIYIQEIDPLTPEYDLPEVTPDQYKLALKQHYGNRLLKDHWKDFKQWDYFYLKPEEPKKQMEYPPEYIDTEKEEKKATTKTTDKKNGKKRLSLKDIFLSDNKRVKKEPVQEERPADVIPTININDIEEYEEEEEIPEPVKKPTTRKPTAKKPTAPKQTPKPTAKPTTPTPQKKKGGRPKSTNAERVQRKIDSLAAEYDGKNTE